jgi:hypothetical protein
MLGSFISGSYENYHQSSLDREFRRLQGEICVLSIPKEVYGIHLEPSSISINVDCSSTGTIEDDGEGKLFLNDEYVGDVIYTHGMVIITKPTLAQVMNSCSNITLNYKSNLPILTNNIHCTVHDYEFNLTQNPTAFVSGSDNLYKDNITGSYFQPYITSLGLYNDANELIAVGKFGQPIPKTPHTDMTFVIKLDM